MTKQTYTLEGDYAVAAHILDEVGKIFFAEREKNSRDKWRLEYYIMMIMCSPQNIMWQVRRSDIEKQVRAAFESFVEEQDEYDFNTAFRRLTRRNFLNGNYRADQKERTYELVLDRWETSR